MIMTEFIKTPHLPQSKVTSVIMDISDCNLTKCVESMGISIISSTVIAELSHQTSRHSDMQIYHAGGKNFFQVKNTNIIIPKAHIEKTNDIEAPYPKDILLNAARVGDKLFCNIKYTAKQILNHAEENNIKIINVKQGYTKCSVCIVNENAIITADSEIYKKAKENNFDALLIKQGYIDINGYNYGFIGGCAGKTDKDKLAFTGDISKHPDYHAIKSFINSQKIDIVILSGDALYDIGGILPVSEIKNKEKAGKR